MASRNSKIFQKRKAKSRTELARRSAKRPERRRVLIVCEGEKTEPLYLKAMVHDFGLTSADVVVCGECGSAPSSVVKFGLDKIEEDSDFDVIFFVIDRDSHKDYDDALNLISELKCRTKFRKKTIEAITSIPCFEIWFLFHFYASRSPFTDSGGKSPCGNLISVLKSQRELRNYHKGNHDYYHLLRDRLATARENAAIILKHSVNDGEPMHYGNPTTQMHVLVDELESIASEIKT